VDFANTDHPAALSLIKLTAAELPLAICITCAYLKWTCLHLFGVAQINRYADKLRLLPTM